MKYGEWLPIETAPHDKRVLVWTGVQIYCAHWAQNPQTLDEAWIVADFGGEGERLIVRPLRWYNRALPLPPKH
jgi:hypothetical protein